MTVIYSKVFFVPLIISCFFPFCCQQYYPGYQNIYRDVVVGLRRAFGPNFRRHPYYHHHNNYRQFHGHGYPEEAYRNDDRFQHERPQQPFQKIFEIDISSDVFTNSEKKSAKTQNNERVYEVQVQSETPVDRSQKIYEVDVPKEVFEMIQKDPQQAQRLLFENQLRRTETIQQRTSQTVVNYESCGESKISVPLVSRGERATKGQWPWLVAVYKRMKVSTGKILTEFRCGATLISKKLVVTAAHCVTRANLLPFSSEEILLKLGAFNLDDDTDETVVSRGVSLISVHEAHNAENKNDIALLVMSQIVRFNFYIRPICLWPFEKDQKSIDGHVGLVVGWGTDELGASSSEPKMVKVPIVSFDKCRSAGAEYFPVTSRRTLCAGARDGSGPCIGDSGSGLFLMYNEKWYIRGIVSLSISKTKTCNLDKYIIYTDVAMYDDWIQASLTS